MSARVNSTSARKNLLYVGALLFVASCSDSTSPATPPAQPHTAASIRVISGSGQTGVVGTQLAAPVVVEVLDSAGKPAWGRGVVAWGMTNGDAITDRSGHATFNWVLGPVAGSQSAQIQPGGQGTFGTEPTVYSTALARGFDHVIPWNALRPGYSNWLTTQPLTRDFLFAPRDTFDNAVAWPAGAQLVAPAGWTVSGDTVLPPSPDFVGAAAIGIQAGGKIASVAIIRVDDLRAHSWSVSYKCAAPPGMPVIDPYSPPLDSMTFTGTTAVVAHGGDPDPQGGKLINLPEYRFYFHGTRTNYQADGTVVSFNVALYRSDIVAQRPDTLVLPYSATSGSVTGTDVPLQPGPKPAYVGGSWCDPASFSARSPVVLTES